MLLSVENNIAGLPTTLYSFTTTNGTAGGTTIPVRNINSFVSNYAVQLGKTGEEQSEILVVSGAPAGTAFNTSGTLRFDHPLDTPVYNIHYNQIVFKRSIAGTAGTATALSTVSITPDSLFTEYNDTSGASTYAYKTQYYNSVSGDLSSESDWFTPDGASFYSLGKLRQRVKNRLFSASYIKSDDVIDDWINEWLEELNNAAIKVNKDYLLGTTAVSFGTAGLGTITASDFMYPRKVEITTDSGVTYSPSTNISINEYSDGDFFTSSSPKHSWQGDSVFRVLPAGAGGTARITYSKGEAVLVDDIDELPFPMRRYSRSFVNYALSCAYENDEKSNLADTNWNKAQKTKGEFINEITPRDNSGIQTIALVDSLSGRNDDMIGSDYFN